MEITQTKRQGVSVVSLIGRLDIGQRHRFDAHLATLLAEKPPHIALDLRNLQYVDSSGIGALIRALKMVKEYGGTVTAVDPNATIREFFELSGMSKFLIVMHSSEFDTEYPPNPAE